MPRGGGSGVWDGVDVPTPPGTGFSGCSAGGDAVPRQPVPRQPVPYQPVPTWMKVTSPVSPLYDLSAPRRGAASPGLGREEPAPRSPRGSSTGPCWRCHMWDQNPPALEAPRCLHGPMVLCLPGTPQPQGSAPGRAGTVWHSYTGRGWHGYTCLGRCGTAIQDVGYMEELHTQRSPSQGPQGHSHT